MASALKSPSSPTATEPVGPGKTLAEKGQHLQRLSIDGNSNVSSSASGNAATDIPCEDRVEAEKDLDVFTTEGEKSWDKTKPSISRDHPDYAKFKLGADSVDVTTDESELQFCCSSNLVEGFLSPTSPTSPLSDEEGGKNQLKSSIRDPNRPKTPPGTPCRKSVRFADALGLDLETVKTILRTESPPDLVDLNVHVDEDKQTISAKHLTLCFQQPGGRADFLPRLYNQNVCLENVVVHEFTLIGTIKVRNLGYEKEVRIRHSSDNWQTYLDSMAKYVQGSCDGPTDRFSFGLSGPRTMTPGCILSFAVYYKVAGNTFWDNNGGENYSLVCAEVKK